MVLNCCKLQVIFESQNKLCNNFRFKDSAPQFLTAGVVYKFQRELCNEPITENELEILLQEVVVKFIKVRQTSIHFEIPE